MPAAFRCKLSELAHITDDAIVGRLTTEHSGFATMYGKSVSAWAEEVRVLRAMADRLVLAVPPAKDWTLLLEYEIPLRNRRPDAVLIADDMLFVIELKVGAHHYLSADTWQVYSYALDLRDYHPGSKDRWIVPILVATDAPDQEQQGMIPYPAVPHAVAEVQRANRSTLPCAIAFVYSLREHDSTPLICASQWEEANYRPTPSIIEAAQRLFAKQGVADLSAHQSDCLAETTEAIVRAIETSQRERIHTICFVTGVPGAGKTLTGLKAAHAPSVYGEDGHTTLFLSGNGPLINVITESLVRDRQQAGVSRRDAEHAVTTFVASVHQFVKHFAVKQPASVPDQHAIIFDEAQRAWSAAMVESKHDVNRSEPELLLEIMERRTDWATLVALIGGGQEINAGEAGLEEWGRSLLRRNYKWRVMIAPHLVAGSDAGLAGHRLFVDRPPDSIEVVGEQQLHLAVSTRSHRAKMIGQWVNSLISGTPEHSGEANPEFPIVMTRDLRQARAWLADKTETAAGGEVLQRSGLLASSGALRLRAFGIEVSKGFRDGCSYPYWFLNKHGDVRSSTQLEIAATEFECQGLELDWAGICWGGDFTICPSSREWVYRKLRGTKWQELQSPVDKSYVQNKYRVLLTRARRGMIVWVPQGDPDDPTRDPRLMDATAEYLQDAGVAML